MIAAGWKHFRHPQANITTAVDLSPQAAHSGNVGLRLRAAAIDAKKKAAQEAIGEIRDLGIVADAGEIGADN